MSYFVCFKCGKIAHIPDTTTHEMPEPMCDHNKYNYGEESKSRMMKTISKNDKDFTLYRKHKELDLEKEEIQ